MARKEGGKQHAPERAIASKVAEPVLESAPVRAPSVRVRSSAPPIGPDALTEYLAPAGGQRVPVAVRQPIEAASGRSLDHARLHVGPGVDAAAASIGAAAFTIGHDIFAGSRAAASPYVLRHELAHVAQSRSGLISGPLRIGEAGSAVERDAEEVVRFGRAPRVEASSSVVHRIGSDEQFDRYAAAVQRSRERQAAADAEAAARRARWEESAGRTFGGALASQGDSLASDITGTESLLLPLRGQVFTALASSPGVPPDLGERYARARLAVEMVDIALPGGTVTAEVADTARATLEAFYYALLSLALVREREDAEREAADQQRRREVRPMSYGPIGEPGERAARASMAISDEIVRYRAPPPMSPTLRTNALGVPAVVSLAEWRTAITAFRRATSYMDQTLAARLPTTFAQRAAYDQLRGLYERQEEVRAQFPSAQKIRAVFYPDVQFVEGQPDVAQGIPWFFYLAYDAVAREWRLMDVTAPGATRVNRRADAEEPCRIDPPLDLFGALNTRLRFPSGRLYFTLPSGNSYLLTTTEPWSLSDWLRAIGLSFAALGLILATAGAGTPAAVAFVVASGYSVASTLVGLHERNEHGMLTGADVAQAALSIVVDVTTALSLGLGTIARVGAAAEGFGQLAATAARYWAPVTRVAAGAQTAQLLVFTGEFVAHWNALANQPGLTPEQRRDAQTRLIAMSTLLGGLQILGIFGMRGELRRGLPIVIETDAEGRQIARMLEPSLAPAATPTTGPAAAGASSGVQVTENAAAAGSRWRLTAGAVQESGLDTNLGHGSVVVDVERGANGLVSQVGLRWGPGARQADIELHRAVARMATRYGGLIGQVREAWTSIRVAFGGRPVPMHIQLEIWKLEQALSERLAAIARGRATRASVADLEAEATLIEQRLAAARESAHNTALRGQFDENAIAIDLAPNGHPPAPEGHIYELGTNGRFQLRPREGHTGARFTLQFDGAGKPTVASNIDHVNESGILNRRVTDPAAQDQLRSLGYDVNGQTITPRNPRQVPLEVGADGSIRVGSASAAPLVGEGAAQGAVFQARRTLPIADALATVPQGSQNQEIVYVLRRIHPDGRQEVLKVGKTEALTLEGRFSSYELAARRLEWNVQVEIIPVQPGSGQTTESIEAALRGRYLEQSAVLPWDNTGNRLGRPGPGTPFAPIPSAGNLRATYMWNAEGRFVDRATGGTPPVFQRANAMPTYAEVMEMLATTNYQPIQSAANAKVPEGTFRYWMSTRGIRVREVRAQIETGALNL